MATTASFSTETVERLIRISKEKPLLPETYVPWHLPVAETDRYLPDQLISLHGHPLWQELSPQQQRELGRHEVVQVMYSYAWSEGLACLFFNRHLLTLPPESAEYRFLLRELIEEFRHQEMFGGVIAHLSGKPVPPTGMHRFWGNWTVRNMPADTVFMSVLAIELMTDVYGKHIRRDQRVYEVLRKTSELHNIEEGRHIHYTKLWLERFTLGAGFMKRSWYSILVLLNLYFMRTLYVKTEIFERLGVPQPKRFARAAAENLKTKLGGACLGEVVEFVQSFRGFNWLTRPLWRWAMNVQAP
jgi:P-aminobenzoate N-oxygenase AurF.